jgi:hypothetical protein
MRISVVYLTTLPLIASRQGREEKLERISVPHLLPVCIEAGLTMPAFFIADT